MLYLIIQWISKGNFLENNKGTSTSIDARIIENRYRSDLMNTEKFDSI